MVHITGLYIYPVKSCRGIALSQARVTRTGFEHDREWLVIQPEGKFLTQRERPLLAQVETAIADGKLILRKPNGSEVAVPVDHAGETREVTIWGDKCDAFDAGEEAAAWLTEHLGKPARLVRFDQRRKRPSEEQWTQGIETLNQFSDGFPWLMISQASLDDLNGRLEQPLPMNRFRPNIVVDGLPPFGEDQPVDFIGGEVRLRSAKPCARCIVTTTDQFTGERFNDEPLRTLKQYRFDKALRGAMFGQNMLLVSGAGGELKVGQSLQVTASK